MDQVRTVYATLKEIGADELPIINVLNKIDRFRDPETACASLSNLADSVAVSALTGHGLENVLAEIETVLESDRRRIEVLLPFARGDLVSLIHERGLIQEETHQSEGTYIEALVPDHLLSQLAEFATRPGEE